MIYFGIMVIVLIGLLLYMIKEAYVNQVIEKEILFSDFPMSFGEVTIFFISDIHRRKVTKELISKVNKKVDLVIIGGDLTEKGVPFERVKDNVRQLKEMGPVYFVWGNNDYEVDYHELDGLLLTLGVKILDNTAVKFESLTGEQLVLLGIDDMNEKRDRLELAMADAGNEGFRILVAHNPKITSKITENHNIRLVLSGHTHGGQIRLFGYSPYEIGKIKKLKQTTLLTSNGYGTSVIPMRLGARAETHIITIKNG